MPDLLQSFMNGEVKFPNGVDNDQAKTTIAEIQSQADEFFGLRSAGGSRSQNFLENIIRPTLNGLGLGGSAAEELLLGTAIQESSLTHRTQLGGGPGLGLFQMEPATHNDIWNNYLKYRPDLGKQVSSLLTSTDKLGNLQNNDAYATAMARVHYLRARGALPSAGDLSGQASYWKSNYNTSLGKGTTSQYVNNWNLVRGN